MQEPGFQESNLQVREWLAFAMAAALMLAACSGGAGDVGPEAPAATDRTIAVAGTPDDRELPVASRLAGIWLQVEDPRWLGLVAQFSHDGSFALDNDGDLTTNPAALGNYTVDDDTITFTSQGSDVCAEGDKWAWQASATQDGILRIVHTDQGTGPCQIPRERTWTFIRLSPISEAGAKITPPETVP